MNREIFTPYNLVTVGEVACETDQDLQNYALSQREEFDMAIPFVPPQMEVGLNPVELLRPPF